jgi:hypothetical protein
VKTHTAGLMMGETPALSSGKKTIDNDRKP